MSELTRMIKLRPLPAQPVTVDADAAERAALAQRFGLSSIESLVAQIELENDGDAVRATGTMRAAFTQVCAVSAEDFSVETDEELALLFVAADPDTADAAGSLENLPGIASEIELSGDELDEIAFSGDAFDLGEAVAQSLGLAIDPYAEGKAALKAVRLAVAAAQVAALKAAAMMIWTMISRSRTATGPEGLRAHRLLY